MPNLCCAFFYWRWVKLKSSLSKVLSILKIFNICSFSNKSEIRVVTCIVIWIYSVNKVVRCRRSLGLLNERRVRGRRVKCGGEAVGCVVEVCRGAMAADTAVAPTAEETLESLLREAEALKQKLEEERQKLNDVTRQYIMPTPACLSFCSQFKPLILSYSSLPVVANITIFHMRWSKYFHSCLKGQTTPLLQIL